MWVLKGIVPVIRLDVRGPANDVGQELEPPTRLGSSEIREVPVKGRAAGLVAPPEGPLRALVQPVDDALDLQTPSLKRVSREAELREGDPQLG